MGLAKANWVRVISSAKNCYAQHFGTLLIGG
jgi:hypothetical protein